MNPILLYLNTLQLWWMYSLFKNNFNLIAFIRVTRRACCGLIDLPTTESVSAIYCSSQSRDYALQSLTPHCTVLQTMETDSEFHCNPFRLTPHCTAHRGVWLHIVLQTMKTDSALYCKPWSLTPHCTANYGDWLHIALQTMESDSALYCSPWSLNWRCFTYIGVALHLNKFSKKTVGLIESDFPFVDYPDKTYTKTKNCFSLFIRGIGWFNSLQKTGLKINLVSHSLQPQYLTRGR